MKSISAFFPAYNDAGTIASMVVLTAITLESLTDDYEIIVINDGSIDHTQKVLDELVKKYPCLKVIHHLQNTGYGGALITGFSVAKKELIFYTDGDAQYDPTELKLLFTALDDKTDVVNGYKIKRQDPFYRTVIGRMYHWLVKIIFNLELKDVDCDFRLIRKKVFEKVKLEYNSGIICVELMKKIQATGFKIKQVPVNHYYRSYGRSQFFNFHRLFRTAIDLSKLWWKLILKPKLRGKNG